MNAKPLNEKALEIARTELPRITEAETRLSQELLNLTVKIEAEKREGLMKILALKAEIDKNCKTFIEQGDGLIEQFNTNRDHVFERIREAQPELQTIEFALDLREGTYTAMSTRTDGEECSMDGDLDTTNDTEVPENVKRLLQMLMEKSKGQAGGGSIH